MKLVTYTNGIVSRSGVIVHNTVYDLVTAHQYAHEAGLCTLPELPPTMIDLLALEDIGLADAHAAESWLLSATAAQRSVCEAGDVQLISPVPRPTSMRDGYAFRQHVEAARRNRGLEMIPEFDEIPIFYFTNHQAVYGPGDIPVLPLHRDKLDFELECAIVIGKKGRNIPANEADSYVAGYMVMNDWSARTLQMQEMKLNLGPAKGKDFATSLGPWLVTRDELATRRIDTPNGETYDLEMRTVINGKSVARGNVKDMTWTFAQIIERASYGVTLYPGDVIGSGTCGTGCFLELNGSKVYDPAWWLDVGDVVECEIDLLGKLVNTVVAEDK
ncbi:MAG TPA: fumarylacetoacetate hydrolase [Bacteroidetes bacterium]|nr:fumarylacetoacetate hydrolase [Bacteroidota bacterium]HRK04121.1 fumarylacetoacetate hydrolase family protein [Chlorobiota bacterium]